MLKQLIIFVFLLLQLQISAQLGSTPILGAKSLSMGNSGAASHGIQSIYFGQAGLTTIDKFAVQLSTEQRFTLSDLNLASVAVAFRPFKFGVIGLFVSNYGIEEYREQKFGFSFATILGNSVAIGAQWSSHVIRIDEYGKTNFIGVDIGVSTQLNEKITLGLHLSNPIKREIVGGDFTIPI